MVFGQGLAAAWRSKAGVLTPKPKPGQLGAVHGRQSAENVAGARVKSCIHTFLTCLKGFVLPKKKLLAHVVLRLAAFFSKISTFPALRRIQSGANPICRQMTRAGEGQRSRHNRGEQIHRKDHQMHYALQHRGSSRAQRQRGDQQRQDQQHGRFRVNAQGQSPAVCQRDNCHCRAVQRAS